MAPELLGENDPWPESVNSDSLTMDRLWHEWGANSGLAHEELACLWQDAKQHYIDLPYHNWQHALQTLWGTMTLADKHNGDEPVNRKVLIASALFHDAGFNHTDDQRGTHMVNGIKQVKSKELHAAEIFANHSDKYALSENEKIGVYRAILATEHEGMRPPQSTEEKILVRADLQKIGGHFRTSFVRNTILLRKEARMMAELEDKPFSKSHFYQQSIKALAYYLTLDLSLSENDTSWSKHATLNLNRFILYAAKNEGMMAPEYVQSIGATAVERVLALSPFTASKQESDS
jgi:HD superfamily phosphodiesterase